jgi:kynurenine formamidase
MYINDIIELGVGLKEYKDIPDDHKYYHYKVPMYKYVHEERRWETIKGKPSFYEELVEINIHSATHVDALCHYALNGVGFEGAIFEDINTYQFCAEEIPVIKETAIMLDLATYLGVRRLESNQQITVEMLEGCILRQNVKIEDGNVLLLRTGHIQLLLEDKVEEYFEQEPGVGLEAVMWLKEKKMCAIGADNFAVEQIPTQHNEFDNFYPFHRIFIKEKGVYIIENLNLEELAQKKIYKFQFLGVPIRFKGCSAALMNPIAFIHQ